MCVTASRLSPKSKKHEEEHECVTNQVLLLSKKSTRKRCSLASCVICSPSFSTSPGGTGIGTPRWNTPSRGILGSMICGKDITRLKMRRGDCSGPCWTHTATSVTVEGTVYTGAASQSGAGAESINLASLLLLCPYTHRAHMATVSLIILVFPTGFWETCGGR